MYNLIVFIVECKVNVNHPLQLAAVVVLVVRV